MGLVGCLSSIYNMMRGPNLWSTKAMDDEEVLFDTCNERDEAVDSRVLEKEFVEVGILWMHGREIESSVGSSRSSQAIYRSM